MNLRIQMPGLGVQMQDPGVQMQEGLPFGYRHTTERSFTNRDRIIVGIQMERG